MIATSQPLPMTRLSVRTLGERAGWWWLDCVVVLVVTILGQATLGGAAMAQALEQPIGVSPSDEPALTEPGPDQPAPDQPTLVDQLRQLNQRPTELAQPSAVRTNDEVQALRRETLLHAARNAAAADNQLLARQRYEQLLKEFPADIETRYELSGRLIQWDQWTAAQQELEQLVADWPRDSRFRETLADVLIQQEQLSEATALLDAGLEDANASPSTIIKLARLLAWQSDFDRAAALLRDRLPPLGQLTFEQKRQLAQCHIERRRADQAVLVLNDLLQQRPGDPNLLAVLVRAEANLDHRAEVEQLIERLAPIEDAQNEWRLELADALYREGHYPPALAMYRQIFDRQPENYIVGAKIARTQLWLLDVPGAEGTLNSLAPFSDKPIVQQAQANFYVVSGQHTGAARLYEQLLMAEPSDLDAQNGVGHLYYSIGDFLRAEAEYRKALAYSPSSLKTIRFVARAQVSSRQFNAAIDLLRQEASTKPRRLSLCGSLVEALIAAKRYDEAIHEAEWGIANSNDPRMQSAMQTEIAWCRLKQRRLHDAIASFAELPTQIGGDTPKVAYGHYRALQKLGRKQDAERMLNAALERWPATLVHRMALADMATAECRCDFAVRMLKPSYHEQPENQFLVIRLAESASQCDRKRGTARDRRYFQQVLAQAPHNTRARLGLARSYARTRCFDDSCRTYRQIVTVLPEHRLAESELSRVAYGSQGVDTGVAMFSRAQRKMGKARFASPPTSELVGSLSAIDNESAAYEQSLLSLERTAKCLKSYRPRASICKYEPLLALDRINEEAYFDLAQVYGQMDLTCDAERYFNQLLRVNPCHTEACIARHRAQLERGRQSRSRVSYFDQAGRDGLANITRVRIETEAWHSIGDEDEFISAGYAHQFLSMDDGTHVSGDLVTLGTQWKPNRWTKLFARTEIASYDAGGPDTRPTFVAGVEHRTCNDVVWRFAGFLENVLENRESLAQDIYRSGVEVSAYRAMNWRWSLSGMYRYSDYSDDNAAHEFAISSNYLHWYGEGRRQLRSLVAFQYFSYDEQSILGPTAGDITGTVHPYFAPESFGFADVGLEWKQWLSSHNFKYATQWWYSIYAGGRVDTEGIGYGLVRARCHRDVRPWCSYGIESGYLNSEVYESTGVAGYLTLRWK